MKESDIRIRFAPAPTGAMHLGNIRTALFNYLFSKQKNGTFVLRIEDTDPERNFDPDGIQILSDLNWLSISYDEGPIKGGPCAPYFQSKRTNLYKERLQELIDKGYLYRCFCSKEELEKRRTRQLALKKPPRYDRTCFNLSQEEIDEKLKNKAPFIWRLKLDYDATIEINDLAHGNIKANLENFSDFPLSRQNGTFTFMFTNCIDDIQMKMTHVIRGEDHLTNTVGQAYLYKVLDAPLPTFWHMPILCNVDGKKLSKRDFGFSLNDLKNAGFLPEAILNYLGIIGSSFDQEILSLEELIKIYPFDHIRSANQAKYDVDKLKWVNHKWIAQYNPKELLKHLKPFLEKDLPQALLIAENKLIDLIQLFQQDVSTLEEFASKMEFYFIEPKISKQEILQLFEQEQIEKIKGIILSNIQSLGDPQTFLDSIKKEAKEKNIKLGSLLQLIRIGLIGKPKGPGMLDLFNILEIEKCRNRLQKLCSEL